MAWLVGSFAIPLLLVLPLGVRAHRGIATPDAKEIAITIDDLPQNGQDYGTKRMQGMTAKLVRAISADHVPVVGFVNEAQLYVVPGEVDSRIALLDTWL